jgi:hypothetical protein
MVVYLGLPVLVVASLALFPGIYRRLIAIDKSWPSFQGHILDSRTARAGLLDSSYNGGILYRLELRVSWMENGKAQDEWMPTAVTSRDDAWLLLFASQHTICTVRRNPHNPGYVIADLADDWQPLHPTSSQNGK